MERWVEETLHRDFRIRLRADRVLFDSETEHQHLIIFENARFGRVMMLDNVVQLVDQGRVRLSRDDGACASVRPWAGKEGADRRRRRRRRAARVAAGTPRSRATLCEIDRGVIDLCRRAFPANLGRRL